MTHRRDVVLLHIEDSDIEWESSIITNNHSYYPVCDKTPDNITGILNTRDYLSLKDRNREAVLAKALRQAWFVPLSLKTDVLFSRMKKNRNHFTVVVDEHGSMMGIVTISDLLEELVGDLEDDSSVPPDQPLIAAAGVNTWYINGAAQLDKVARELEIILPLEKYDTFAGFVFSLLGQIPEDGSKAELEAFGLKIKILEVREHRLEKALVIKEDANA
jgi:putative hemolysin